jgi:hypothetical protein
VLLPKHSLIHIPQPGEEETQSKFAMPMTDCGDGARGVEVEKKFEGRSLHIFVLGELNCFFPHVTAWASDLMTVLYSRTSTLRKEYCLNGMEKLTSR